MQLANVGLLSHVFESVTSKILKQDHPSRAELIPVLAQDRLPWAGVQAPLLPDPVPGIVVCTNKQRKMRHVACFSPTVHFPASI